MVMDSFQELAGEVRSLKEQLMVKERLAALGEVSAGIAHEFRNPMGVIAGYAQLLRKSLDETDSRREIVEGIIKEIREMDLVMEELLKFSRSEPINRVQMDLEKLLNDVIKSLGEAGQKIKASPSGSIVIKGDETLIKQAVRNLIQNALEEGDEVSVSMEKGTVSKREGVFIDVKDDGRGIAKEDLDRVFMPFYTKKAGGLGIGLSLVQKVAIAHKGKVLVESVQGKGSTFRLFLPLE